MRGRKLFIDSGIYSVIQNFFFVSFAGISQANFQIKTITSSEISQWLRAMVQ